MKFQQFLLYPASVLYKGVAALRNRLYEADLLSRQQFPVPVIVVGNLAVGGTGKTPHTEYLLRLFRNYRRLAVLSRGYKRKTSGFILAGETATAETIGDEPMLYHTQFPGVQVGVGEKRPEAIVKLLQLNPPPEVIVLDDAFQHRPLQASFYLLLTDFAKPFFADYVLPAGRLRESPAGAARAHAVVVTKCPGELSEEKQAELRTEIGRFTKPGTPVFFSSYEYGQPECLNMRHTQLPRRLVLLTAIANPAPLAAALRKDGYELVEELTYPDHYAYKAQDMEKLARLITRHQQADAREIGVVTTSKDAMKLQKPGLLPVLGSVPVFFVPIEVKFLNNQQQAFDQLLLSAAVIANAQA